MNPAIEFREHIVSEGESLWSIACASDLVTSEESDIRDVIDLTMEANDLKSVALSPGKVIQVPYLKH